MEYKDHGAKDRFVAVGELLYQNGTLKLNSGAEIGVREGFFSEYMLGLFPKLFMDLVDPYTPYQDVINFYDTEKQKAWALEAAQKLAKYEARYKFWYETSAMAVARFYDASFDFVFIDAEHTTPAVITDITLWKPKIRKGGILCGHDYAMPQVRAGVDKMFKNVLHIKTADVWAVQL